MKRISSTVILLFFLLLQGIHASQNPEQEQWYIRSIKIVEAHAQNMLDEVMKDKLLPRSEERGRLPIEEWTSGFYPGILWYLYEYTQDDYWKKNAETVTAFLEQQQYNTNDHDIGFRISCSYGKGYELTHNESYKKVIIQSAQSLCTRYNPKTKAILSWNPNPKRDWKFPVIIDNMMNLELLYQAAELSGNKKFTDIALNHAITTMNNHFRKDYSCPHVVDYDPKTGQMRRMDFNNGYNDPSKAAWSRGQAWALYGYTFMYRVTKDKTFLDFAEKIASYILDNPHMPDDLIPYWDYNAPKIPTKRDASAAAINAAALLELSTYPTSNSQKYFDAAEKTLKSLSSDEYLAQPGTNGNFAIKHATGNFLGGVEVDNAIIYADYYFIEALCRYLKLIQHQDLF
ncbi:glycoside hydrolase family 88 protein [Coprobacter fastidiosus]